MKPFDPENWNRNAYYLVYNGCKNDKKQIAFTKIVEVRERHLYYTVVEHEQAVQIHYRFNVNKKVESIGRENEYSKIEVRIDNFEFFELSIEELANFL